MADKRISGLTAMTTASKDDILLVVDDPAGTPTNKKITIEKFFSNVESTTLFANITAASNSSTASVILNGGLGIAKNLVVDGNVSVNGVFTMSGNGAISNLSSNVTPGASITHDLGNTTASWKDAYVQEIKGHSGALSVSANVTLSANLTTSGANVYVNGTDLTVDANTTVKANLIVHSDSTNTVINSGNTHVTSNTILAGTDTTISSNLATSANVSHSGANVYFNTSDFTVDANTTLKANLTIHSDSSNTLIESGNTHVTGNTILAGTNTVISSNATLSGANSYITSNATLEGTNTVITSNVTITSANVYINPSGTANLYLKGMLTTTGNTTIGDDLSVAGNVNVTDTTDSSTNTTGSIVTAGGVGIAKSLWVGENVNIHGNLHANGNITADGGTITLGSDDTDTVSFGADVGSHIIPDTDSTYDLGTTAKRFRNIWLDDAVATGNVNASGDITATGNVSGLFGNFTDNVKISTDKSLQLRDDTEYIHSNADGEISVISGSKVTITTTSLNTSANTTLAGETANVTANLFISGANTKISSANTTLDGTKTTIEGTDLVVTANTVLPQFTSNTILVTTGANTNLGGSVNISGNVEMSGTANIAANTFIGGHANVRGTAEVAGKVDVAGNVTIGTTSAGSKVTIHANNNLIINSNNENEFIKIDTQRQEVIANLHIETLQKISTSNGVYLKDDTSLVFGGQLSLVDNDTTDDSGLLLEDGTAHDSGTSNGHFTLEDASTDRFYSNSTGLLIGGDLILDGTEISSANGVINLGTYGGLANGVIRVSDAYNLPNTAGANGQFLRLLNGNVVFASGTGTNLTDIEQDLTPQLGADLDLNGFTIGPDASRANTNIVAKSDGVVVIGSGSTSYFAHNMTSGRTGVNTTAPDTQFEVFGNANVSLNVHCSSIFVDNHNASANGLHLNNILVTTSAAELNTLDGYTGDVADFNKLSGTSDTLSPADLDAIENFEETVSATTSAVTIKASKDLDIAGHDATTYGLKLGGTLVTSTAAELNILDGCLADVGELNKLQIVNDGQTQPSRFLHTDSENRIDFTALDGSKPGQVTVANVVVTGTTTSSSNTTGALKVTGGAGIAKSVNVGQKLSVWGNTSFNSNVTIAGTVAGNQIFYDKTTDDLNMKIRVVSIGTTSTGTSEIGETANNIMVFGNGVAPTSVPDGQAYLYAKDNGGGETHLYTKDEGGTETILGPHNADGEWEFFSRNTITGKTVRINMERMIRKLEEFTGEKFIENE